MDRYSGEQFPGGNLSFAKERFPPEPIVQHKRMTFNLYYQHDIIVSHGSIVHVKLYVPMK
jgi:hypothetical protein